jgi:DNA-binding transcriptional MerR regulator
MAERSGVSAHTLRYYERIGLLGPVPRAANGHRQFSADDVGWVQLLVCLRETGMNIQDMLRFADVDGPNLSVAERRLALLEAHREAVRARQRAVDEYLQRIEGKLNYYRAELIAAGMIEENT